MNRVVLTIFRSTSGYLYKLIGPNKSTQLSQSTIGKLIFKLIMRGSNKEKIYNGHDGIKLKLSKQEALNSGFVHLGVINPYETGLIKKLLKANNVFVDIGAYVDGWHSIIAAKLVGKGGVVFTFEPVPQYCKKLKYNINLNKLKNVVIEQKAVADRKSSRTFYIGGLASTLYAQHLEKMEGAPQRIKVSTVTLDEYLKIKNIKRLDLIKIDAEGAELEVIKGASKMIAKFSPDLIVEVANDYLAHGNSSEKELFEVLKKHGYKAYSITDSGIGKYMKKNSGRELMNVFFSKKKQIELKELSR